MRGLLSYSMRGRSQAIIVASALAVLAPYLPPLSLLTGGIVGLATLRNGLREGALVILGSLVSTAALLLVVFGSPKPVLGCVLVWLPILLFSELLRRTGTQNLPFAVVATVGLIVVLIGRILLGDPSAWWTATLTEMFAQIGQQTGMELDERGLMEFIGAIVPQMTGILVSSLIFSWLVTLLLARWWHAILDNPGGFAAEFRQLCLPQWLAFIAVGLLCLSLLASFKEFALDLLLILVVVYTFQGIALVHSVVAGRQLSRMWLVALYVLLFIVQWPVVVALATLGMMETWLRLRTRLV